MRLIHVLAVRTFYSLGLGRLQPKGWMRTNGMFSFRVEFREHAIGYCRLPSVRFTALGVYLLRRLTFSQLENRSAEVIGHSLGYPEVNQETLQRV